MNKISNKLKQIKWHIWLKDITVIFVIVFAVNVWQSRGMLDDNSHLQVATQMLVGLDGQTSTLIKPNIKPNKPTLIYFFAPWCKICSLSIGNLGYLDTNQLNIVTVALDYSNVEEVQYSR